MSETRWTPGPWHAMRKLAPSYEDHGFRQVATIQRTGGKTIYAEAAQMAQPGEGYVWGDADADAHLIAAAPDLYAALETLRANLGGLANSLHNFRGPPVIGDMKAAASELMRIWDDASAMVALAKARGET